MANEATPGKQPFDVVIHGDCLEVMATLKLQQVQSAQRNACRRGARTGRQSKEVLFRESVEQA